MTQVDSIPTIQIFVEGGIVTGYESNINIQVEVIDYDIDEAEDEEITKDANGDPCRRFFL